jgi:hypothetical protein
MIAYKFLSSGALGPFSRYAWPLPRRGQPGAWVIAGGKTTMCRTAVHGCRVADLPWWLQDELWEAEFDGSIATGRHKISAPRARLLRRVEGWDGACAQRFADACAWRARDHAVAALERAGDAAIAARIASAGELRDLPRLAHELRAHRHAAGPADMAADAARRARGGFAVVAAYIAAHAASRTGGASANAAERAWQADWLRGELGLCDEFASGP